MADVLANSMACHPRASCQIAGCCHLANLMTCYPGATCHIQGEGVSSAMLKIVFCHILFFVFLMQFGLWRMAAFVSSSIHLLYSVPGQSSRRALRESPSARPLMRDRGSPPPARDSAVQIFPQKLHAKQVSETWMANTVSPRRYQYALATDEQTNEHTNKDIAIV